MVEDTEAAMLDDEDATARPAFQIVPTALALPRPTAGWQVVVALVLLGFTLVSSLQVGLVANIAKLPKVWWSSPFLHGAVQHASFRGYFPLQRDSTWTVCIVCIVYMHCCVPTT